MVVGRALRPTSQKLKLVNWITPLKRENIPACPFLWCWRDAQKCLRSVCPPRSKFSGSASGDYVRGRTVNYLGRGAGLNSLSWIICLRHPIIQINPRQEEYNYVMSLGMILIFEVLFDIHQNYESDLWSINVKDISSVVLQKESF